MEQLLASWRAAERRLDALLAAGGAELAPVRAEIASLRARHQQLFDERVIRMKDSLDNV